KGAPTGAPFVFHGRRLPSAPCSMRRAEAERECRCIALARVAGNAHNRRHGARRVVPRTGSEDGGRWGGHRTGLGSKVRRAGRRTRVLSPGVSELHPFTRGSHRASAVGG